MTGSALATSLITAGLGLIVFVLGQLVIRIVVDPLHQHRLIVGEIASALVFYADRLSSPMGADPDSLDAKKHLRRLASELCARTNAVALNRVCASLGMMPQVEDCIAAASDLIGLSNGLVVAPDMAIYFTVVEANQKRKQDAISKLRLGRLI